MFFLNSHTYNTSPHFWAKDMGQSMVLLGKNEYLGCILGACCLASLLAWVEFPFSTLFINIFGLGFYEGSQHLLQFILISLISCGAKIFFFLSLPPHPQWVTLIGPSLKTLRMLQPLAPMLAFYALISCINQHKICKSFTLT